MQCRTPCAVCCTPCTRKQLRTPLESDFGNSTTQHNKPFASYNLLAVGTVAIKRAPHSEPSLCDHFHADDGWHQFNGTWHSGYLENDDVQLAKQLQLLVSKDFIRTTYNVVDEELIVRIYIIPDNLRKKKGRRYHQTPDFRLPKQILGNLIRQVSGDRDRWFGCPSGAPLSGSFLDVSPDGHTFSDIYSDLASPTVYCNNAVARLLDSDDELADLGVHSVLHHHQRRSIAAMITRELNLRDVPDPLYLKALTIDGKEFYHQPGIMKFTTEHETVASTQGGLLCEELGTGEIITVLTLIQLTLNQLPLPPKKTTIDLTPIALRTFPSGPYATARNTILYKKPNAHRKASRIPLLSELMLHSARVVPLPDISDLTTVQDHHRQEKLLGLTSKLEMTPLKDYMQKNVPLYVQTSQQGQRGIIMYLSRATLVVVAPNLLSRWHQEINKHCDQSLRVLTLRSDIKVPSAISLANDFDIVLMTYKRYISERANKDVWRSRCQCPDLPGSRIPDCKCPSLSCISPLFLVRWKRLVIDEGPVSASLYYNPAEELSVERKWIITSTPTMKFYDLSLRKSEITLRADKKDYSYDDEILNVSEDERLLNIFEEIRSSSMESRYRRWNWFCQEDFKKLETIVCLISSMKSELMKTHVCDPLTNKDGPQPGSIQVLNQVMRMIMVQHGIENVEKDVISPPVEHELIFLDLDPVAVKSYNVLQAIIATNAVDSQRTKQDYLFHPKNTNCLRLIVKKLSQLMFWHVDETLYNLDQIVENARANIERTIQRNMSQEDIQLAQDAMYHIQLAASDKSWRQAQTHVGMSWRVRGISKKILNAWSRTPLVEESDDLVVAGMLHADRLLKLQANAIAQPLITEECLVEQGSEVAITDLNLYMAYEQKALDKFKARKGGKPPEAAELHTCFMYSNVAQRMDDNRSQVEQGLYRSWFKKNENHAPMAAPDASADASSLPSSLAGVVVGSSASSKLNYIMNEVIKYSVDEKILIFSNSELTLTYIAEALELIQVKFLWFTTWSDQVMLGFETLETCRVFLMELEEGAHGSSLISASRIIFCEPVWKADVESRAIQRTHRPGQTRPVTVKTLAIRGTAEENMVKYRNSLKGSHDMMSKLVEGSSVRHFFENPKFLTHVPENLPTIEFPLLGFSPKEPTRKPLST